MAKSKEIKVRMLAHFSGTRDGQPWPTTGSEITLPEAEAREYIECGYAQEIGNDGDPVDVPDYAPDAARDQAVDLAAAEDKEHIDAATTVSRTGTIVEQHGATPGERNQGSATRQGSEATPDSLIDQVPTTNVDDVIAWVGDNHGRALAALEVERKRSKGKQRSGVIDPLEKMTAGD